MSLPHRSTSNDEAIPDEDASETTKLFEERLQAWKHACGYLEEYVKATEKCQGNTSKEYEKVLKAVISPLKEGHHFHQQSGGVAEMFDNIRSNTQCHFINFKYSICFIFMHPSKCLAKNGGNVFMFSSWCTNQTDTSKFW